MPSQVAILLALIAFRIFNASLVQTYFSPDEYWQALEVGHHITFGYGYLTWEWRNDVGLRSVLHPFMFAALYKALAWAGVDHARLFIIGPRLLQAVFAALADFYTYKFARRLFKSQDVAWWTLLFSVGSWWNFFCSTRTLANSLEASLTIIALYYWPFPRATSAAQRASGGGDPSNLPLSLTLAFATCLFRPTAAILWVYVGLAYLAHYLAVGNLKRIVEMLVLVVLLGSFAIGCSAYLDFHLLYHEWIWTPINFLRVNVFEGISLFYGTSAWHWYLSQGIPILFTIYIPFVAHGAWISYNSSTQASPTLPLALPVVKQVLHLSLWILIVYSSLTHKEWRFLYPIFYPLLAFAGYSAYTWTKSSEGQPKGRRTLMIVFFIVAANAPMAWYTTMVHQRGVVDVMNWIRQETHAGNVTSLGVLMPCHSTPWTSSVHHPLFQDRSKTWFITCEPPLGHTDPKSYKDESDLFYEDPVSYMDSHNIGQAESHIIIFEDLWNTFPATKTWFVDHGYQECARFFNSHFHDDSRRRGDVVALCKV